MSLPHAPASERRWWLWAACAIGLGAWLRLSQPHLIEFGGEQIDELSEALAANAGGLAQHGVWQSNGLRMPPFFYWILGAILGVTQDPVRITTMFAAANVVALAILFLFLCVPCGARVAALVTTLQAATPWALIFSRKVWPQDLLLLFGCLAYWALWRVNERATRARVVAAAVAVGLFTQLYPSAWFVMPGALAGLLLFRPGIRWRDLALAVGVFLLLWSPWIVYQFQTEFSELRFMFNSRPESPTAPVPHSQLLGEHARWSLALGSGTRFDDLLGLGGWDALVAAPLARFSARVFAGVEMALVAAFVLALWIAARTVWHTWLGRTTASRDRLVTWFVLVVLSLHGSYAALHVAAPPHYHVVLWPALPLFLVELFERAGARLGLVGARIAALVPLTIALAGALFFGRVLRLLDEGPQAVRGRFDTGFILQRDARERELALRLDQVRHRKEREAEELARLERAFAASQAVLLQIDTHRNQPPLECTGRVRLSARVEGLEARGLSFRGYLLTPAFGEGSATGSLLRLEATSPAESWIEVFYLAGEQSDHARKRLVTRVLRRGRSIDVIELPPGARGPLLLRFNVDHVTLHALEVRAAP